MKSKVWILFALAILFNACHDDDQLFLDEELSPTEEESNQEENQANEEADGSLTLYEVQGDQIVKLKDYTVSQRLLPFQQDYAKHFKMWELVVQLFPIQDRDKIAQFEVFHGDSELSGYVAPVNNNDLSKWKMGLAIDGAEDLEDINLADFFTYVTIHEYGHILTLNDNQIDVNNQSDCDTYFTGEGCSYDRSYINKIYELGWEDIIDELDYDDPQALYEKYPNRFVSDYAATNPGEDIAEVFATFVTKAEKPSGSNIAEQKIRLLYDFPELVNLRDNIRQNANPGTLLRSNWRTNPRFSKMRICGHKGCKHKRQN